MYRTLKTYELRTKKSELRTKKSEVKKWRKGKLKVNRVTYHRTDIQHPKSQVLVLDTCKENKKGRKNKVSVKLFSGKR